MNNWKTSLDKYLTTPPDDGGYEAMLEAVYDKIPPEVQEAMEKKDFFCSDLETKWMDKLSQRVKCLEPDVDEETGNYSMVESGDLEIEDVAAIITLTFKMYCK